MKNEDLELLYRSFDDSLTPEEQKQLDEALTHSKALREEKTRIVTMRKAVSGNAARSFKPYFAERVMQRIEKTRQEQTKQDPFFESLLAVFRPVAMGAAVLMIILLTYNMIKSDRLSLAGAFAEPEVTLEEAFDPTTMLAME